MFVYLNGRRNGGRPTIPAYFVNEWSVRIGQGHTESAAAGFDGLIDEVSIFGRGRSAAEIKEAFDLGVRGRAFCR